jgi:hypothetical protein
VFVSARRNVVHDDAPARASVQRELGYAESSGQSVERLDGNRHDLDIRDQLRKALVHFGERKIAAAVVSDQVHEHADRLLLARRVDRPDFLYSDR